jgi:hypothetical protein
VDAEHTHDVAAIGSLPDTLFEQFIGTMEPLVPLVAVLAVLGNSAFSKVDPSVVGGSRLM